MVGIADNRKELEVPDNKLSSDDELTPEERFGTYLGLARDARLNRLSLNAEPKRTDITLSKKKPNLAELDRGLTADNIFSGDD